MGKKRIEKLRKVNPSKNSVIDSDQSSSTLPVNTENDEELSGSMPTKRHAESEACDATNESEGNQKRKRIRKRKTAAPESTQEAPVVATAEGLSTDR